MADVVNRVDDIDQGTPAERFIFAFGAEEDGLVQEFEIDLGQENADKLREEIAFWTQYARPRDKRPAVVNGHPVQARQAQQPQRHPVRGGPGRWWETPPNATFAEKREWKALRDEMREWGNRNGFATNPDSPRQLPKELADAFAKGHRTGGKKT